MKRPLEHHYASNVAYTRALEAYCDSLANVPAIDTSQERVDETAKQRHEQEPVQCEPQEVVTEDGWCEWVCPKPVGYLMQCCDCGLIHEVESRVAKYEPRPSEVFEVVDDPDLQVQWRMKRRDDISPKQPRQWQGLTEEEINSVRHNRDWTAPWTDETFARAIEAKLREKNHG